MTHEKMRIFVYTQIKRKGFFFKLCYIEKDGHHKFILFYDDTWVVTVIMIHITKHFSLRLMELLLCTGWRETERFFSNVSRSRKRVLTLWFVLADVSRNPQPHWLASAWPSLCKTSRLDGLSSHLLPTWKKQFIVN